MSLKFVSLHSHTGASLYDGLGSVEDNCDWLLKNAGEDSGAFVVTNHGNCSDAGYIAAAQKKYKGKLKLFYGFESYYLPSIQDWHQIKADRKEEEKKKKKTEDDDASDLVIENEKESKAKYYSDPLNRRNHLVLVAYNPQGLKNLFTLISRSYREGFYRKPRIDFNMLRQLNEGIVASTACLAGIPNWVSMQYEDMNDPNRLKKVFNHYDREIGPLMEIFGPDRFFLEIQFNKIPQQHQVNLDLIEYSKQTNFKLLATADSHYCSPDLFRDRELYKLLGYQMRGEQIDKTILEKTRDELEAELYLKNGDQMFETYKQTFYEHFKDEALIKESIERGYHLIHDFCQDVYPDASIKLPKTFTETEVIKTPFDKLKQLCLEALRNKGLNSKEYIDRAAYELKVIKKLNVAEYFLALKEMLDKVREKQLTGTARGSGAGSIVNYLLNISFIDPLKNNLLFERFMSPSRAELPDIDSDLEDKETAFELFQRHFGADNVLAISNWNRLQLKSLIKDISRVYDVPFEEVNQVTKIIEAEAKDSIMEEIDHDQKLYELSYEKAMQYSTSLQTFIQKYPKVGERIENLYREIKSCGRHAGGVLVVPNAEQHLPIIKIRGTDQSPITEGITAQHLKYFGLVKFDMLGLATLRIIRRCIELILRDVNDIRFPTTENIWDFYNKFLHPDIMDPADPRIFQKVYQGGNFPSIFQFAEKNVQKFCVRAKPENVGDISALTAIWRPGPLKGGADKKYIFYDPAAIQREHPIIQEILGNTRGILIYQEQFMLLAHKLAGFSLEDADKLRKLLVKPSHELGEEMKKQRIEAGEKFIKGCIEKGLSEERAKKLWNEEILGFVSYGFNKSHSVSYAYNSYQCAWLYTYFEDQWIKACLECDPKPQEIVNVVRQIGFKVEKPDVNKSSATEWFVKDKVCFPPFNSLKGIGDIGAEEIVRVRETIGNFKSLQHFFYDENGLWRWSKANKRVLETLMKMEAFSSINIKEFYKNYKHMHDFISENYEKIKKGKVPLSEGLISPIDDWNTTEKMEIQREIVGFYDKSLIIHKFRKTFDEFDICGIDECDDEKNKTRVWGILEKIVPKSTKNGKSYIVASVSGITDKLYTVKVWDADVKNTLIWKEGHVVIMGIDYDSDYGYSVSRRVKPLKISK
jgi:DNA polymerase III subunit alpha